MNRHGFYELRLPLHVGYGSDKGVNICRQVQYNGKGTKLHSIWDSRIIEKEHIKLTDLGTGQKVKVQPVNFMTWLNKSRALLPQVYIDGHTLDDAYMQ